MEDFIKQATNPHQYDAEGMDWEKEGAKDSPSRQFFKSYLRGVLDVKDKKVLDIGSGTGQLFDFLNEYGAVSIEGIEPSVNNVEISRKLHPNIPVFLGTLARAEPFQKFDVAIAVMVFEHILDIQSAFAKVCSLLNDGGQLYLIVGDKDYNSTPRFEYILNVQDIGNDVVVAKCDRPWGTVYDILRPLRQYIIAAEDSRFVLERHIPCVPTKALMELKPEYALFAKTPLAHLLVFAKK